MSRNILYFSTLKDYRIIIEADSPSPQQLLAKRAADADQEIPPSKPNRTSPITKPPHRSHDQQHPTRSPLSYYKRSPKGPTSLPKPAIPFPSRHSLPQHQRRQPIAPTLITQLKCLQNDLQSLKGGRASDRGEYITIEPQGTCKHDVEAGERDVAKGEPGPAEGKTRDAAHGRGE